MANEIDPQLEQLKGALDVLFTLKEEFAQWADEAQDGSKHESLDNVLNHVENMEAEYRKRLKKATQG
ncbi:MAG: hypothetical protein ACR2O0_08850 [Rhizobiaceae bacterium]